MHKKSASKAKSLDIFGYKVKPIHGMATGAGLILLKGFLGISVLVGLVVLLVSTFFYAKNHLKK